MHLKRSSTKKGADPRGINDPDLSLGGKKGGRFRRSEEAGLTLIWETSLVACMLPEYVFLNPRNSLR